MLVGGRWEMSASDRFGAVFNPSTGRQIARVPLGTAGDVDRAVAAALGHDGPVLVDAVVNRQELAMPPAVTLEMAKGFTLYMVRAVMNGRADEVIDLAATNLCR
jgi:pyruvate dehydrogenase (quinone)